MENAQLDRRKDRQTLFTPGKTYVSRLLQ